MENLQDFHTFHLPSKAKKIIKITALSELIEKWKLAKKNALPILFLGQGSNVLFVDDFKGIVFINQLMGIEHKQDANFHYLHVNGGENWHNLVQWSLTQGIYGLENLALIPGCAGSAPIQNIGAYGVEFKDVCDYVDVLDLQKNTIFRLSNEECAFAYRESIFKRQYREGYFITAVGLKLAKNWQPVLKYGTLTEFDTHQVNAQEIFTEICHIRQSKLPNPDEFGNSGSFFKNPIISAQAFSLLQQDYPTIPFFPQPDGTIKLAAGWLIDQAGLKGYQIGGAAVHQKQALVIINKDNASSADVVKLAQHIHQTVILKFNVYLQPEVRFIGENGEVDSTAYIS